MSTPKEMKAIKVIEAKNAQVVSDAPVPPVHPTYVLVKVSAVALNPTDWKHIDNDIMASKGATVGCDYAGTVVEVGSQVTKNFKPGDRIAGFAHGVNGVHSEYGAFGQYAIAKGDVQMKVPDNITDEQAATVGVGISTVGQGMYQSFELPWPDQPTSKGTQVLIYAGSTNTGMFAIQFAKLSGLQVITTCSPKNNDLVKSLGADVVFDHNDPECGSKIRAYTNNKLQYAFDCIGEKQAPAACAAALTSESGANYWGILPNEFPRKDVTTKYTLGYTINGEEFPFRGNKVPAKPEDFEFARKFWTVADKVVAEGKIQLTPTVREGGLEGVLQGLDDFRNGRVSGQKLVYKIA